MQRLVYQHREDDAPISQVRTEEGILETISGIRILSCEKKHYCGIPAAEYRCSALFRGEQRLFRLYYYPEQGKWKLSWEGSGERTVSNE